MKKILSAALSIAIVISTLAYTTACASSDITVELDGKTIDFDVKPQIIDGCTMVPLRKIFEEIGAFVKWDDDTKSISARKNSKTVTLEIGSNSLKVDRGKTDDEGNLITETVALEVPAQVVSDRTLVPVRAVSESFDLNVEWDEKNHRVIITSDSNEDNLWKENVGFVNLSELTFEGNGIEIDKNQIKITKGGDYTISGTLKDGNITVSAKEKVKLRLDDVSIVSDEKPCIYIEEADKVYITLNGGTENNLYTKNCETGAIYSKENIEIKGNGKLTINASAGHGIKASDNLNIENGDITINSAGDGIHINDTFKMTGGKINITADSDGIDSESIIDISGGTINIKTTAEPIKNALQTEQITDQRGMFDEKEDIEFEKSSNGINADWMMCIYGGEININSASHAIHCQDEIQINDGKFVINSEYGKGISAHGNLTISGADTVIDIQKSTEGMESKNILTINDGMFKIVSSDDAINATGKRSGDNMGMPRKFNGNEIRNGADQEDQEMQMNENGRPNTPPSENMVRQNGTMPNGGMPQQDKMKPNGEYIPQPKEEQQHSDKAPQAGGPVTESQGFGNASGDLKDCLVINGGYFELLAYDDCLDSNGNLIINGGTIKASNPNGTFSGPFAVIDADGTVTISKKASLLFSAGNGNSASLNLKQNTLTVYCENTHDTNDKIEVSDASGNIIYEYISPGKFSSVLVSSENFKMGGKYKITVGNEVFETTITEQSTVLGTKPVGNKKFENNRFDR